MGLSGRVGQQEVIPKGSRRKFLFSQVTSISGSHFTDISYLFKSTSEIAESSICK
jgi:hypothetical protein